MTSLKRCLTGLLTTVALLLAIVCLGDNEQAGERRVVFEEVGEYADGGMAVAFLPVAKPSTACKPRRCRASAPAAARAS